MKHGISVVMPVHNAGHYLQSAVTSILEQTHQNLELILVNDFSTDDAISTLGSDKRLRVFESPKRGIVHALNHGIAQASFPYIARMDGDDIAHPRRLELQLQFLLDSPVDIAGTKVELFKDNGAVAKGYALYQQWINQQCTSEQIARSFFIESCIPHPSAMMHRDVLSKLGGYHNTPWPEDYDLWCRAHLQGFQFGKPETPALLQWRDHESRASRVDKRYAKQQFLQCKARYLGQWLQQRGFHHCVIWGAGPTGLKLHDYLEENAIQVNHFVDVNPKLKGVQKRGKRVDVLGLNPSAEELTSLAPIGIIAVNARGAREKIRHALNNANLIELNDYVIC